MSNLRSTRRVAEHRHRYELSKLTCATVTDEECINTAACVAGLRPGAWYPVVVYGLSPRIEEALGITQRARPQMRSVATTYSTNMVSGK